MTSRERIKSTLEFKIPDRVGIYDCLWDQTQEIWQKENCLPKEKPYQDFFGYDIKLFEFDQSFLLLEKELESDGETITMVNGFGATERRFKDKAGASQVLDSVIKTKKDWRDFKALLTPCEDRIKSSFENEYNAAKDSGMFLVLGILDPFQHAAAIFGLERLLTLMAEGPELIKDIFSSSADLSIDMCNLFREKGFVFDAAWLWSDLAYKNGCFFSVSTYKALLYSYHKKLCTYFNLKDMPVIFHCDGNFLGLLPLLLNVGVRALNPLEVDCGFNIEVMKSEYGKDVVLFGNIDTGILQKDKHQIEVFFSKHLNIAKKDGGFIYHSDKPIPPTVSFQSYEFALEMVRKYGVY